MIDKTVFLSDLDYTKKCEWRNLFLEFAERETCLTWSKKYRKYILGTKYTRNVAINWIQRISEEWRDKNCSRNLNIKWTKRVLNCPSCNYCTHTKTWKETNNCAPCKIENWVSISNFRQKQVLVKENNNNNNIIIIFHNNKNVRKMSRSKG